MQGCWDGLKRVSRAWARASRRAQRRVARRSIHVTGCARSEKERAALDRLVASEQGSAASGLGGSWLVHGDRIRRSRFMRWRAQFLGILASTPKGVEVCFCGPTPMAHDYHAAAGTIKGFSVEVSSADFNEGKLHDGYLARHSARTCICSSWRNICTCRYFLGWVLVTTVSNSGYHIRPV
jgi:hypothetical protein